MTPTPSGERVLVVDDEPDIVALVAYHLAKAGYRVATASSGTDALESVRRERPAIIVLDLMLPGMSGYEVVDQLRANDATRDVAVLMLTARREESGSCRARHAPARRRPRRKPARRRPVTMIGQSRSRFHSSPER